MEKVSYDVGSVGEVASKTNVVSVGKPPWSHRHHTGKLERMILQLGAGRGEFSELYGIPRSMGCIGNNRFVLRREPLPKEHLFELVGEFKALGGSELWITNYDDVGTLLDVAEHAVKIGIDDVYAVVLLDDLDDVVPVEGVNFVAELRYSPENFEKLLSYPWLHGALVVVQPDELEDVLSKAPLFNGEVYVDVLFPRSARYLAFNVIELRRIFNPTVEKYHDCLAGTIAVTPEGYLLPCPLLRNYVVVDLTKDSIKTALRKKKLRSFWNMSKDSIPSCSKCPFKYLCHDCRALEYQATGEIDGMEYCPMLL